MRHNTKWYSKLQGTVPLSHKMKEGLNNMKIKFMDTTKFIDDTKEFINSINADKIAFANSILKWALFYAIILIIIGLMKGRV